jgi:hypothetical protein
MIEFTVLEMTLLALCVALFFRNMHHATRARSMCHLVDAMCKDDAVLKQVKQASAEAEARQA